MDELTARGHKITEPIQDSTAVLRKVHSERYLSFLATAWDQWVALDPANTDVQPFPSVWPVRTLRSDVEPENFIAKLGLYSMDNGTPMVAGTWEAIKSSADAAVSAANLLSSGTSSVFCAVRPPGHHAGVDFMGGYCFLNNAAVAAQALIDQGCAHVAILDVDYHHGNGTQSIFYDRPDVLFVSIHAHPRSEYPFYSGYADEDGVGAGEGFNLNLPLPTDSPSETWFAALEMGCKRIEDFPADALVVSLGLDTFVGDPLGKFNLSSDDFFKLGKRISSLKKPTAIILEGGYATKDLGINAANVLDGFDGA
jgi:acetoin utilization deacetylase AcuC-like enzyme